MPVTALSKRRETKLVANPVETFAEVNGSQDRRGPVVLKVFQDSFPGFYKVMLSRTGTDASVLIWTGINLISYPGKQVTFINL